MNARDVKRQSLSRGQTQPAPLLLDDPMEALPPTAQRLLAAAQRLLARGGFPALSLSAVAAEAGESKASIGYHFGNKDGLITALVDSLAHDANRELIRETRELPPGEGRVRALVDGEARIVADEASFQSFFEVLPHALRDESLRERVAALYEGYRETVVRCLGPESEAAAAGRPKADRAEADRRPFATLMIALVDGLAVQHGLDPEGVDLRAAMDLWERLARPYLAGLPVAAGAEEGAP